MLMVPYSPVNIYGRGVGPRVYGESRITALPVPVPVPLQVEGRVPGCKPDGPRESAPPDGAGVGEGGCLFISLSAPLEIPPGAVFWLEGLSLQQEVLKERCWND